MNVNFVDKLYQDLVEILYKLSGIKYKMKENNKTAYIKPYLKNLKTQIENILDSVSEGNTCHKHDR